MTLATDLAGSLACETYRRVAEGFVQGFNQCAETSWPLKELQAVELLSALVQAFDGLEAELAGHLEVDAALMVHGKEILDGLDGFGQGEEA